MNRNTTSLPHELIDLPSDLTMKRREAADKAWHELQQAKQVTDHVRQVMGDILNIVQAEASQQTLEGGSWMKSRIRWLQEVLGARAQEVRYDEIHNGLQDLAVQ